jgi:hypothetical protein
MITGAKSFGLDVIWFRTGNLLHAGNRPRKLYPPLFLDTPDRILYKNVSHLYYGMAASMGYSYDQG